MTCHRFVSFNIDSLCLLSRVETYSFPSPPMDKFEGIEAAMEGANTPNNTAMQFGHARTDARSMFDNMSIDLERFDQM